VAELERRGRLARIRHPISVRHEITEIHRRVLSTQGPALLFEKPILADGSEAGMPVLANLFGTVERVAWGLGIEPERLEDLGEFLAELRQPHTPRSAREAMHMLPLARAGLAARTSTRRPGEWTTASGVDVDLSALPIQWCWPDEPAPLITWPLVITSSPEDPDDVNVGVYRMQVLDKRNLIVRWLAHRGGARHHREWQQLGKDMPIAIAIGADPATILAAVMPLPEGVSELAFSGLLRGTRTPVTHGATVPLSVPSTAEIVLEGFVSAFETAPEGPYGDHTGYYNSVDLFPVVRLTAVRRRRSAMYLTTFTGRPPDEPSRLGEALTPLFVPLAKRQFPEIRDLWLPPEACSYRMMVVSIDKRYPGQARRLMMGLWSMLPQFTYTKIIVVVDGDIDVRRWDDVVWALSTRFDAPRDLVVVENTPMDYLDFASTRSGLGGKVGFDATNKIGPETDREWGRVLRMSAEIRQRVDDIWDSLGLEGR
jgi:4-hydroxy-3-polyprenylbenzoate decarboxylase